MDSKNDNIFIKKENIGIEIEEPNIIRTYLNENRQLNTSLSTHQSKVINDKCNKETFSHNGGKADELKKEITHFSRLYPEFIKCEVTDMCEQPCEKSTFDDISDKMGDNIKIEELGMKIDEPGISTYLSENEPSDESIITHQSKLTDEIYNKDTYNHNSEADEWKKEITHFSGLYPEFITCEVTDTFEQTCEKRVFDDIGDKLGDNEIKIEELGMKIEESDISTYLNENETLKTNQSIITDKICNKETFSHNSERTDEWKKGGLHPECSKREVTDPCEQIYEKRMLHDVGDKPVDSNIKIEEVDIKLEEPNTSTFLNEYDDACNEQFTQSSELTANKFNKKLTKSHKITHTGRKTYQCDVCKKCFKKANYLTSHRVIHADKKEFKCDVCNKEFTILRSLIQHRRVHTGEKPYKCDVCEKRCRTSSDLMKHRVVHTGEKPYTCDVCYKNFTQKNNLVSHKLTHTGEKPHECDVCNKRFTQVSHLVEHKRTHTGEKPFNCPVCNKACRTRSELRKHRVIHTGERPYKCDVCDKTFTQSGNLLSHKIIHTGEKMYKCDVCDLRCAYLSNLIAHKLIHTGERPHNCDVCNKRFTTSSTLARHKLTHTGEKPFKCDMCKRGFSKTCYLIKHKLTHTDEKLIQERPYSCDVCDKRFTKSSRLARHKLTHTGKKTYKCDICNQGFTESSDLVSHKLIHTG